MSVAVGPIAVAAGDSLNLSTPQGVLWDLVVLYNPSALFLQLNADQEWLPPWTANVYSLATVGYPVRGTWVGTPGTIGELFATFYQAGEAPGGVYPLPIPAFVTQTSVSASWQGAIARASGTSIPSGLGATPIVWTTIDKQSGVTMAPGSSQIIATAAGYLLVQFAVRFDPGVHPATVRSAATGMRLNGAYVDESGESLSNSPSSAVAPGNVQLTAVGGTVVAVVGGDIVDVYAEQVNNAGDAATGIARVAATFFTT